MGEYEKSNVVILEAYSKAGCQTADLSFKQVQPDTSDNKSLRVASKGHLEGGFDAGFVDPSWLGCMECRKAEKGLTKEGVWWWKVLHHPTKCPNGEPPPAVASMGMVDRLGTVSVVSALAIIGLIG